MYFEEVDFCHRARRAGWPCWYVPAARVVHLVGQSSGVTDPRSRPAEAAAGVLVPRAASLFPLPSRACQDGAGGPGLVAGPCLVPAEAIPPAQAQQGTSTDLMGLHPLQLLAGEEMTRLLETPPGQEVGGPPPLNRGDRNRNPPGIGFIALLREDLRTHDGDLLEQGFWAVAVHRFGNWRMGIAQAAARPADAHVPSPLQGGSSGPAGSASPTPFSWDGGFGSGTTAG